MIHVTQQPEPATFETNVRRPGREFLRRTRTPTKDDWSRNAYWIRALPDMRTAYQDVCAYCSLWVPTQGTVDHYVPKSQYAAQAFEWANYRLAMDRVNSAKGSQTGLVDPFAVVNGWFVLNLTSFFVEAEANLNPLPKAAVEKTINGLKLNADALVRLRFEVVRDYSKGDLPIGFLERRYPFIAAELKRQGQVDSIKGTIA